MYLLFQLQRSSDTEEAQNQLMKANELEELQEEAQAAYHQGDYSTTITLLERVIEVGVLLVNFIFHLQSYQYQLLQSVISNLILMPQNFSY